MAEYQSRDYCRGINCKVQQELDTTDSQAHYRAMKAVCKFNCRAYDFHHWLEKNGYKIIKED